ncbi:hypothetical protein BH10PSE8_BH10PSE8_03150 [soil metagenome]
MNALPVACSNDWLGSSSEREAPSPGVLAVRYGEVSRAPDAELAASDIDAAERLSLAQQGFLELRLEAALGRLTAMETLIEAERFHVRQAQTALAVAERALQRHRETIVASDQQRQDAAGEIERLKQGLHEMALEKARQDHHIAALMTTLASRTAEIERLKQAGACFEADLRAARTRQNVASDALQRECLRLEETLQGERRDKILLQRALDLARANRRALQDQLLQPTGPRPPDHRIALRPASDSRALPGPAAMPVPETVSLRPAISLLPALLPHPQTLEQDRPMQPTCSALTEHLHAACN